ncbi:hypothetical protein [Paenibacillus dokdonensis]|uniref:hypothetical protein n=1 Tax=Paenibacillus dokdonensis TaxID=2567944 RepID=UPI003D2A3DC0
MCKKTQKGDKECIRDSLSPVPLQVSIPLLNAKKPCCKSTVFKRPIVFGLQPKEDALELTKKETAAKVPFDASRVLNYFQDRAEQMSSSHIVNTALQFGSAGKDIRK